MPKTGAPPPSNFKSRATRFPLEIPLTFREQESARWWGGKSLNISGTGILFHAEQQLEVQTIVEIRFPLAVASKKAKATVVCHGPVVRSVAAGLPEAGPVMAVAIRDYHFLSEPNGNGDVGQG